MADFVANDTFREIRRKRGSRKQLATLLGTSITNITCWERGETWPEPAMLRRLCALFGMSPEELGFSIGAGSVPTCPSPVYDSAIPLLPVVPIVGRAWELFQIKQRLKEGGDRALMVLNGLPGVGKTALAINLAHDSELRAHFCEGIVWTNLGLDAPLLGVLRRWASLLGISETQLATLSDVSSWATAVRIAIGNRKMLVVIDDACKLEDVLTLCVGGPNCAYIVTTRFAHIATHVAPGGTIRLQELQEEESIKLFNLLAPRVVDAEPDRMCELARSVGGLPLALMLMGNYLRTQTANKMPRRITAALERLSHSKERLQVYEPHPSIEKHTGLPDGALLSLQSVIAVSDQLLDPSSRATLYALSIFPPKPQSFSKEVALVVASCTYEDLDNLCDAGMVECHDDRYMLHRVIADYARLQLQGQAEQDAIERLITSVSKSVEVNRKEYDLLEEERSTICAALDLAHSYAYWEKLVSITCCFVPFLIVRGLYREAEYHLQRAYAVTGGLGPVGAFGDGDLEEDVSRRGLSPLSVPGTMGRAGTSPRPYDNQIHDPHACIQLLSYLGEVAQKRGELAQAETHLQRGLAGARSIQHNEYICDLLKNLGWVVSKRGDYTRANVYLQESLQLARRGTDNELLCSILSIFGSVLATKGEYGQADNYLSEGLSLARRIGDRQQTCFLLINRGILYGALGDFLHAEEAFHEGLFHARQLGHREWISLLLTNLGGIACEHDDYQLAEGYFQEVLELVREMGHRELLCVSLVNLAGIARKQENYVQAHSYLEESLALARQIEQPQLAACVLYEYAELHFDLQLIQEAEELFLTIAKITPPGNQELFALACYGLARALAAQGNISEARKVGTQSAEVFETMQHRKAQEVRLWLEDLPRS